LIFFAEKERKKEKNNLENKESNDVYGEK